MDAIRVLLAFESPELRRRPRLMIDECDDIEVVGEAGDAVEVLERVATVSPDVLLIDAKMPHVTGIESIRILQDRGYSGAVIVVSDDVSQLEEALRSGATGYLLRHCPADEMLGAIRQVSEGDLVFGGSVMNTSEGMEVALRYMKAQKRPEGATAAASSRRGREDSPEGAPKTPTGDIADRTESPGPRPAPAPEVLMGDVDLLIPSPVDTTWVLSLYQWLRATEHAEVNEVAGSWEGDTVVKVTFRRPIPIRQILVELPDIAEVTEEEYTEDSETVSSFLRQQRLGGARTLPKRFRLALKHE